MSGKCVKEIIDGVEQSNLPVPLDYARIKNTITQLLNTTGDTDITWDTEDANSDSGKFTQVATGLQVIQEGRYELDLQSSIISTTTDRADPIVTILINGSPILYDSRAHYARNQTGVNESTSVVSVILDLSANDIVGMRLTRNNIDLTNVNTIASSSWIQVSEANGVKGDKGDKGDTGDVSGPVSSTDNAIVRWDGVDGNGVQDSGVIIDDSDNMSGVQSIDVIGSATFNSSEGTNDFFVGRGFGQGAAIFFDASEDDLIFNAFVTTIKADALIEFVCDGGGAEMTLDSPLVVNAQDTDVLDLNETIFGNRMLFFTLSFESVRGFKIMTIGATPLDLASNTRTPAIRLQPNGDIDFYNATNIVYHYDIAASTHTFSNNIIINNSSTLSFTLGTTINEFSIDGTLIGNSDDAVPTEQAVKTYVDDRTLDKNNIIFKANDSVGGTNINVVTPVIIPLGTTDVSDASFSLSANRVTVDFTGAVKVSWKIKATQSSADRTGLKGQIFKNASAVLGTDVPMYVRGNPSGTDVIVGGNSLPSMYLSVTSGDILDLRASRDGTSTQSTTTVANECWLQVERVR